MVVVRKLLEVAYCAFGYFHKLLLDNQVVLKHISFIQTDAKKNHGYDVVVKGYDVVVKGQMYCLLIFNFYMNLILTICQKL